MEQAAKNSDENQQVRHLRVFPDKDRTQHIIDLA